MPLTPPPTTVRAPGTTDPMVAPISAQAMAPPPGFARMHAEMTAILLISVEKLIVGGDRNWKHRPHASGLFGTEAVCLTGIDRIGSLSD